MQLCLRLKAHSFYISYLLILSGHFPAMLVIYEYYIFDIIYIFSYILIWKALWISYFCISIYLDFISVIALKRVKNVTYLVPHSYTPPWALLPIDTASYLFGKSEPLQFLMNCFAISDDILPQITSRLFCTAHSQP